MKTTLFTYLAIGGAGFLGAIARFTIGRLFAWSNLPLGTFIINVTGCFILGWFLALIQDRVVVSDMTRLAVTVGFVGAYTTFSTYIFESNKFFLDGSGLTALLYLQGSLVLGLIATRFGVFVAHRF